MSSKGRIALFVTGVVAAAAGLFAAYIWIALHVSYSDGERAGFVQKLSRKGWLCKTWEGELALVAMPGSTPEKFFFTIRDDDVAAKINALVGKRVVLFYEQHKGLPGDCLGETEYFIKSAKIIDP